MTGFSMRSPMRQAGFHGCVDTLEMVRKYVRRYQEIRILPNVAAGAAKRDPALGRPLICANELVATGSDAACAKAIAAIRAK